MIKNIIFDLGNVVILETHFIIMEMAKTDDEKDFTENVLLKAEEWQLLDLGLITNEELIQNISSRNNPKFKKLIETAVNEFYKRIPINEKVVEIAKTLKQKGYKIYVLSNMAKCRFEYINKADFFKLCEGEVVSCYEHVKKPDKRIFDILLTRYNLNPEECLLIDDDDTGKTYAMANKLGIAGRNVKPNDSNDIKKMLKEYGIEI